MLWAYCEGCDNIASVPKHKSRGTYDAKLNADGTFTNLTEPVRYPYAMKYSQNDFSMVVKDGRVFFTVEVPKDSWFGVGLGKGTMTKATMIIWVNYGPTNSTAYDTIAPGHYLSINDLNTKQLTNEMYYDETTGRMKFITSRLLDPNDPIAPPKTPEYVIKMVIIFCRINVLFLVLIIPNNACILLRMQRFPKY